MLNKLKTEEDYIYALIEWDMLDDEHLVVKYAWVHKEHRREDCLEYLIRQMAQDPMTKSTQYVGWERGDKHIPFKWYPVHKLLRLFVPRKKGV